MCVGGMRSEVLLTGVFLSLCGPVLGVTVDFERTTPPTMGEPEIVESNTAPGYGTKTHLAVYRPGCAKRLSPQEAGFAPRTGEGDSFESSVRLYQPRQGKGGALVMVCADEAGADDVSLGLVFSADGQHVTGILREKKGGESKRISELSFPASALPADFRLVASADGTVRVEARSVATAKVVKAPPAKTSFFAGRTAPIRAELKPKPAADSEIVIDNYAAGEPLPPPKLCEAPLILDRIGEFDPTKAGWPLVFSDDFEGDRLDETKWYHGWGSRRDLLSVTNGAAHFLADWNKDNGDRRLQGPYIIAKKAFRYGYFEARVKFSKMPGWWMGWWLCTPDRSNAFLDGTEIDIYEDFYTRRKLEDGSNSKQLHYTYYNFSGGTTKNWNFDNFFEGGFEDWHTVGCRWTPFEISFYLDGRIVKTQKGGKSAHDTATCDAAESSAVLAPLYPMLNFNEMVGECWNFSPSPEGYPFPEDVPVDWVRVWAYPQDGFPSVAATCDNPHTFANDGDTFRFSATAKPGADGTPIKAAYLFDSGYLLAAKTEPPYDFDVTFSKEWYHHTRYLSGTGGGNLTFEKSGLHVYSVFVQDEKGRTAHSEPILKTFAPKGESRPFEGKAAAIPGRIVPGRYDEGGGAVAYYDTTPGNVFKARGGKVWRPDEDVDFEVPEMLEDGKIESGEWLNYTVDIAEADVYDVTMTASCIEYVTGAGLELFVDGERKGRFELPDNTKFDKRDFMLKGVQLPSGRHRVTVLFIGRFYFGGLEFRRKG